VDNVFNFGSAVLRKGEVRNGKETAMRSKRLALSKSLSLPFQACGLVIRVKKYIIK
jgi:hypothetical protein